MEPFATSYDPKPVRDWVEDQSIKTIPQLFDNSAQEYSDTRFLGHKEGGTYVYQSYSEIQEKVRRFSSALLEQGIEAYDRVAQISNNRPEWVITDLGTMGVGKSQFVNTMKTIIEKQVTLRRHDRPPAFS